jgi:hypothetical protein
MFVAGFLCGMVFCMLVSLLVILVILRATRRELGSRELRVIREATDVLEKAQR